MTDKSSYDAALLPDLLPIYYKKLFPYGPYFKWLNYGGVYSTIEEARKICLRAEETSNVDDDDDDEGRKRKVPQRYRKESDSSDEADDEGDRDEQRNTKQREKRPTPPPEFAGSSLASSTARRPIIRSIMQASPCTPSKQINRTLDVQRRSPRHRSTDDTPSKRRRTDKGTDQAATSSLDTNGEKVTATESDSALLRQILDKLEDIKKEISYIKEQNKIGSADVTEDEIQEMLPSGEKLNTPEQLEEFEDNLNEGKRKKIVAWLASLENGENGGAICRAIMRALMTNKLMSAYSGFGQKGKRRFIGTETYKIMLFPKTYFSHREFSFTLKDDVYIRYQSFSDQQELEKEIQKRCPYKIDIGAIFSHKPKEHKTIKAASFQAQEKELVFDIDMTDYDDVRTCCSGADICDKCWPLMQIAIKIIDRALKEDFGFEHRLWVYSGRRGVHCWVCDENARKLSQNGRSAIAEYLSLVKGGDQQTKKVNLDSNSLHPFIRKSVEIVKERFDDYAVKKQDFMGNEERQKKVLALIPDEILRQQLEGVFKTGDSTKVVWSVIKRHIDTLLFGEKSNKQREFKISKHLTEEIMLQYSYPRLDVNVSKGVNHLLKSPFCIHPKTGRVCVPIDPENIDDFDPGVVPTISQLLEELNVADGADESGKKQKEYKRTSLKESMVVFEKFLKQLEESWRGKLLEQSDKKMEF